MHQLFRFFPALFARQILDRAPMLELRGLDHVEQCNPSACVSSAARCIMDGDLKLLRFVDHNEENALMCDLCHL